MSIYEKDMYVTVENSGGGAFSDSKYTDRLTVQVHSDVLNAIVVRRIVSDVQDSLVYNRDEFEHIRDIHKEGVAEDLQDYVCVSIPISLTRDLSTGELKELAQDIKDDIEPDFDFAEVRIHIKEVEDDE